jgi:lactam utilization protein B
MPHINIANIAGSFHASNPVVMHKRLEEAMCNTLADYAPRRPDEEGL